MMAYSYLSNLAQSIHIFWSWFYSIEAQAIKFRKSSLATFKMDNCNDRHIPTCMLDNMTNLLPSTPHGSAWLKRCLEVPAKALQTSSKSILFRQWNPALIVIFRRLGSWETYLMSSSGFSSATSSSFDSARLIRFTVSSIDSRSFMIVPLTGFTCRIVIKRVYSGFLCISLSSSSLSSSCGCWGTDSAAGPALGGVALGPCKIYNNAGALQPIEGALYTEDQGPMTNVNLKSLIGEIAKTVPFHLTMRLRTWGTKGVLSGALPWHRMDDNFIVYQILR